MPDSTTFSGAPIPTGPEGAWVPGSMMAYAEFIDPKLVHSVASQAARDASFATLPAGSLVTCAALNTIWMRTASGWSTLFSDSGWITAGFGYPGASWSAGTYARIRNRNGTIEVRAAATYAGATTAYPTGNVINQDVLTLPGAYAPAAAYLVTASGSHQGINVDLTISGGIVQLVGVPPGASLVNGELMTFSATWLEG